MTDLTSHLFADQVAEVKEGDLVELFGHINNIKRIVMCERLGGLSFQNDNTDGAYGHGEFEKPRGNKMLSTFTAFPHYKGNVKIIGFKAV